MSNNYTPPQTEIEKSMAKIWGAALKVSVDSISVHDNFFELGGQCLVGLEIVLTINETLSMEYDLEDLFNCPTIYQLSRYKA